MDKVFLIDDNPLITDSLKDLIRWEEIDCHISRTFTEAKSLLDAVRNDDVPDIVITDIRMPGMDGIELLHVLREEFHAIEVIILSAFGEFSYARKAIRYGAKGYLLKPVVKEDLIEIIRTIQNEREEKKVNERFDYDELVRIQKALAPDLLPGVLSDSQMRETLQLMERPNFHFPEIPEVRLAIATVTSGSFRSPNLLEELSLLNSMDTVSVTFIRDSQILFIIPDEKNGFTDLILKRIRDCLSQHGYPECSIIAFTDHLQGWQELAEGLRKGFKQSAMTFYHHTPYVKMPLSALKGLSEWKIRKQTESFIARMQSVSIHERISVIEDLMTFMQEQMIRQETAVWMSEEICKTLVSRSKIEQEDYQKISQRIVNLKFVKSSKELRHELEIILTDQVRLSEQKVYDWGFIRKAKEYIAEHLDEKLSLDAIAAEIGISKSHFCTKYKDMTGETFWNYINRSRVERAKEYLISGKSQQEAALAVGYENPGYLIRMFKRYTGHTPREYIRIHG